MLAAACAIAGVSTAAAAGSTKTVPNWAAPQIATVVAHKLMDAKSVKNFKPNAALTQQTLADLQLIAVSAGQSLRDVNIRQPNLEDVFLSMTGRKIRD